MRRQKFLTLIGGAAAAWPLAARAEQRQLWYRVIRLISVVVLVLPTFAAARAEPKRLLIINSFGNTVRPWSEYSKGIRDELLKQWSEPLNIYETSLEIARFDPGNSEALFANYLQALLANHNPDLVVNIGVPAADFFLRYLRKVFPLMPTLLTSVEERRVQYTGLTANDAVVALKVDFARVAGAILQVLPETTEVAVVIGNSPLEQYWVGQIRSAFQPFADRLKFTYLNELSFDEMLKQAAALPPRSTIYFNLLSADEDFQAISRFHAIANAPIFSYIDTYFGQGIIGGPLISVQEQSQATARAIVRMLRGEEPAKVRTPAIEFGVPRFDWREMRRWGISESRLPAGSKIYFRDPPAWQKYQWQVLLILAVILAQAALIARLIYEHRRRNLAEVQARQRAVQIIHLNRTATAGALSASVAHELNQPLGAILNYAETADLMLAKGSVNVPALREIIADIRRDDQRASEIIKHMRGLLKRRSDVELQTFDINEVITEAVGILKPEAMKRGIALDSKNAGVPLPVHADRIRLEQVILNLVANGMDAVFDCTPDQRRLLIQAIPRGKSEVEVAISDSGPGIPKEALNKIFDAFFTTKASGTGLGLSIAQTIVENFGGRIWAENGTGGGAVFRFTLPLATEPAHNRRSSPAPMT